MDEESINYDLLEELLDHICSTSDEGAILVFLPGLMEARNIAPCHAKQRGLSHTRVPRPHRLLPCMSNCSLTAPSLVTQAASVCTRCTLH